MNTISGLPAHVLLLHFVVVLVPGTAVLEIVCALWPAARRRLVWLVLIMAAANTALTWVTANAGEWLFDRQKHPSAVLREHAERGEWMIYFSAGLLVVAIALAGLHWLEGRSDKRRIAANVAVAIVALLVGFSSMAVVYRVGDAGAHAVWGGS